MNWQTMFIPIASGVNTESDPRALQVPELAVCRDAEFVPGGLQTRKPYAAMSSEILGSTSLVNVRRVATYGTERLVFTKDKLYSWSVNDAAWVERATHLAAKVDERSAFVDTTDQCSCDRAELSGVTIYAWTKVLSTGVELGDIYVAAQDTETGATLLAPTRIGFGSRPRLIVLSTQVVLFYADSVPDLKGLALDPSGLATSVAATPTSIFTAANGFNSFYDAVGVGATAYIAARRNPTTSYSVMTVTEALVTTRVDKARVCDGPIALAVDPSVTRIALVRANNTDIQGDVLNASSLADVATASAIGTVTATPVNQIAACFRSVQDSGVYRCYAFWTSQEGTLNSFITKYNYMDTAAAVGTQGNFRRRLGVVSRAFDRDGHVYLWLTFGSVSVAGGKTAQIQNTYFLYRDDITLVAKAAPGRAGGFSPIRCHISGVQSLGGDSYGWCGVDRRVIPIGTGSGKTKGYADRGPRDVIVTFDSDEARRCAQLGGTLYVTGGEILQYDGVRLVECGFHVYPHYFAVADAADAGTGIDDGDYTYRLTWAWQNAKGGLDRSTTATTVTTAMALSPDGDFQVTQVVPLAVTHKDGVSAKLWRTAVDPTDSAPSFLVTDPDPANVAAGANNHLVNDPTAEYLASPFEDELPDATLTTKEPFHEDGGVLENLAPPAATIIVASSDRLFLAGIADDPNQVRYSKLRGDGEVAAFHDALVVQVPPAGGDITALAFLNETLIVFKERAIYALPGDGFDNLGQGQNFGPPRLLSTDVGAVSAEAVCTTPEGLVFHSRKGWHLLGRGWSVDYIGARVKEWDDETFVACTLLESKHEIRCLAESSVCLVYNYRHNQWSEWTIDDGLDATIWDGTYSYLAAIDAEGIETVKTERSDYTGTDYGLDVEFPWIKVGDPQGQARIRWLKVLGEYRSAHRLQIRVARNYEESDASGPDWFDDLPWTPSPTTVGGPLDVRHGPSIQVCQAVKVRLTAIGDPDPDLPGVDLPPDGEALRLTGLSLEVGVKRGMYRRSPAAQKQ